MQYNHFPSLIWLCAAVFTAVLSGCQTNNYSEYKSTFVPLVDSGYFEGELSAIETPEQIFVLPADTERALRKIVANSPTLAERTKAILRFILSYADDGLLYDNSNTLTASETLQLGKANCLSLSILAYSLATEVGIDASFQDVLIPEYFTSELNQTWLNGHVNLRLKHSRHKDNSTIIFDNDMIVDFDPYSLKQQFPTLQISPRRIVAMFYNNKAAVYHARNNAAQAYNYFKAAINIDPDFAVTWSNLGILYRSHGLLVEAEAVYLRSLALDNNSINTMANLAYLYRVNGNLTKAISLEEMVYDRRRRNPYFHNMLAEEAYKQDQIQLAISHYKKAISLDKTNHEAYFGLAKSYFMLEKPLQAAVAMNKAHRYAPSRQDKFRYQKKLSLLNQIAQRH